MYIWKLFNVNYLLATYICRMTIQYIFLGAFPDSDIMLFGHRLFFDRSIKNPILKDSQLSEKLFRTDKERNNQTN